LYSAAIAAVDRIASVLGATSRIFGFLTLDHVNGNGAAHRKKHNLRTGGAYLWRWVRDHGFPPSSKYSAATAIIQNLTVELAR